MTRSSNLMLDSNAFGLIAFMALLIPLPRLLEHSLVYLGIEPESSPLLEKFQNRSKRGNLAFGFCPQQNTERSGVGKSQSLGGTAALRIVDQKKRVNKFQGQGQRFRFTPL